jgi:hypothetical protein
MPFTSKHWLPASIRTLNLSVVRNNLTISGENHTFLKALGRKLFTETKGQAANS